MSLFWKTCGITAATDAGLAAELGADAVGFVFWPASPRAVTPWRAAAIAAELPEEVRRVGVFVDAPRAEVLEIAATVGLDVAQLHGDEKPGEWDDVEGLEIWKALRLPPEIETAEAEAIAAPWTTRCRILVDAAVDGQYGGTGETADWDLVAALAARHELILAGGLTPDNVATAVERVGPWGVDVASGVEAEPGRKDHDELRRFAAVLERYR